jgi:endoglucanase
VRNDDPGAKKGRLELGDTAIVEGQAGSRAAQFVVTLTKSLATPITVHFATADGSATAGTDYTAASATLTIPAGSVSGIISVPIIGDSLHEGDESFTLTLSGAAGATITHATGNGTILDDD